MVLTRDCTKCSITIDPFVPSWIVFRVPRVSTRFVRTFTEIPTMVTKLLLSLVKYANWRIRRYRRTTPIIQQAWIFAIQFLIACLAISFGALAPALNYWMVLYGVSLLALTLYIHLPDIHNPW